MSNDQRPSARWSPGGGGAGGLARSGAGGDQMARGAGDRSHWAFDHSLVIGSLRHWSFRLRPFHWKQRGARISHHVSSGAPAWSRLGVLERPKPVTDRRSGRSGIQAGGEKCRLPFYTAAPPLRPPVNCLFLYSRTLFASSRTLFCPAGRFSLPAGRYFVRRDAFRLRPEPIGRVAAPRFSLSPREARVGREPERGAA